MRPFKGLFCDDVSEFESYMPSQAVWSLWVKICTPHANSRQMD